MLKTGAAGNRVVPYNKDCYKITLSSQGSSSGAEKDQAIIEDTTFLRQHNHLRPRFQDKIVIWKDGPIKENKEGQEIWATKPLTEVLELIYTYSNKKYGEYGKSCKLGRNITVDRIRVTNLSCLKYDSSCIIGSCDSRTLNKTVTFEQIEQELKKREKKVLYRDPVPSLTQDPVENMEDWRTDTLSHFPYTKIMPYDAYFENLENWVNTKQNKDDLIHVYTFLTKHIYKSLFLEAILNSQNFFRMTPQEIRDWWLQMGMFLKWKRLGYYLVCYLDTSLIGKFFSNPFRI